MKQVFDVVVHVVVVFAITAVFALGTAAVMVGCSDVAPTVKPEPTKKDPVPPPPPAPKPKPKCP